MFKFARVSAVDLAPTLSGGGHLSSPPSSPAGLAWPAFGGSRQFGGKRYIQLFCAIAGYFAITSHRVEPGKGGAYTALYFLGALTMSHRQLGPVDARRPANVILRPFPRRGYGCPNGDGEAVFRIHPADRGQLSQPSQCSISFWRGTACAALLKRRAKHWRFLPLQFRGVASASIHRGDFLAALGSSSGSPSWGAIAPIPHHHTGAPLHHACFSSKACTGPNWLPIFLPRRDSRRPSALISFRREAALTRSSARSAFFPIAVSPEAKTERRGLLRVAAEDLARKSFPPSPSIYWSARATPSMPGRRNACKSTS
jgi:hypothetical protein